MATIRPERQRPTATSTDELLERLRATCDDKVLLKDIEQQLQAANDDEIAGRLLRTNKGALMARLTPSRWPIAMYKRDWVILVKLVKSGAVEHALESMNILDDNPEKSERQLKQERSVQIRDRSQIQDREEAA